MTDHDLAPILERITFEPENTELREIPWPYGLEPAEAATALNYDGSLPQARCVIITYTAAEAEALADVLTPGAPSSGWVHYSKNWAQFSPQLTSRSPAREAGRLGEFHMSAIADLSVLCFHSQLHPATDGPTVPLMTLAAQIAQETGCQLLITTGTAGGVGANTVLGDINIANVVRADLTSRLKGHSWSQESWTMPALTPGQMELLGPSVLPALLAPNASKLPKQYATRAPQVFNGGTISTDTFAYGTVDDHFGLLKRLPGAEMVEMDDWAVVRGVQSMANPPVVISCRDASDPVMGDYSSKSANEASEIYRTWGYTTAAGSAIVCWALAAGLGGATNVP